MPAKRQRGVLAALGQAESNMWGYVYQSMMDNLGASPDKFQLIYPFTSWNWRTASMGHTYASEYDFLSTVPQWSGVGVYQSSGTRLSDAYGNFLMALVVSADPVQKQKIVAQQNVVQGIANDFTRALEEARRAYEKDKYVVDNEPSFLNWLSDPLGGYAYGKKLYGIQAQLDDASELLAQLIEQSNDPTFKVASERFNNQAYWTRIDTDALDDAVAQPGYSRQTTYMDWVQQIEGGGGGMSGSIGWSNSQEHFDWSKTWAGGETSYGGFFAVYARAGWEQVDGLATSLDISVEINMRAWEPIPIQDAGWFDGAFLQARADGEYRQGWGRDNFFGPKGSMGAVKTQMYVCYQPSFSITSSSSFTEEHRKKFEAAGGIKIGPFRIGGGGGHESVIYDKQVTDKSFSGESKSSVPFIFGVSIQVLGAR